MSNQNDYNQAIAFGIGFILTYNSINNVQCTEIIKERGILFDSIKEEGILRVDTGILLLYEIVQRKIDETSKTRCSFYELFASKTWL